MIIIQSMNIQGKSLKIQIFMLFNGSVDFYIMKVYAIEEEFK